MNRLSIIAAFFVLLLLGGQTALAQSGYDLFQKGLVKERTEGDLDGAIRLYKQIVAEHKDDRALAAKALIQMGGCYEKLGQAEAQKAYQHVIEEYPGQKQEAAIAKERIAELSKGLKGVIEQPTFRKIEIASKPQNGVLSPDGNQLAFISDGAVWVVPLHGKVNPDIAGEPVRLAEVPGIWDAWNLMAWSADGKWIAVNAWLDGQLAVNVLPVAGGERRVVQVPARGGHAWSHRVGLSPGGQKIAISALKLGTRREPSDTSERYIYTIPTAGGEPKQVSSGWARLPSFSPDGKLIAYVGYRRRTDWQNSEGFPYDGDLWVAPSDGGAPIKLASVDGRLRGPVWSPDRKYIAAHHEPSPGNDSNEIWVFPLSSDVSRAGEPTKVVLPRISRHILAGWTPRNELGVFIVSESHTAIYTVTASGGKAVQVTPEGGPYYPRWSPDGKRIYFTWTTGIAYVPAMGGDPVGVPSARSERPLGFVSPGAGYNISPDGKNFVLIACQGPPWDPNEGLDVWTIPVDGGLATRLTNSASFKGYPCWSPDGKWVAFVDEHMKSEEERFNAIYMIPAEEGEIRQVSSESDKVGDSAIAFSPDGEQIAFLSEGSIKMIPVEGGQAKVLVDNVKSGRYSQLVYSPDGSKIAHNIAGKIWITQLDGGKSDELQTGLPADAVLGDFSWSPDGKKIAFVGTTGGSSEFWLISNFLPEPAAGD